jgi:2-deoxy-D-gluconate 3-dehydrogenase
MQGKGIIILISSIYGWLVRISVCIRQALLNTLLQRFQSGILGLTRYVAAYYANSSIRINALSPGGIYNNHEKNLTSLFQPFHHGQDGGYFRIGDGALLFLASDASSYMTGANLVVDGGWTPGNI